MKLKIEQVEHIANLARLDLTKEEKEKFSKQLSSILDYVEKLKEVDTTGVEETSQVTGLKNSVRPDEFNESSDVEIGDILNNAPDKEGNLFKVKSVFDK